MASEGDIVAEGGFQDRLKIFGDRDEKSQHIIPAGEEPPSPKDRALDGSPEDSQYGVAIPAHLHHRLGNLRPAGEQVRHAS